MRRVERAITSRADILRVLDSCGVMHLGLSKDGQPYVVPLNFGWEEAEGRLLIYFHGALSGKKQTWIAQGAACFATFTGNNAVTRGLGACDWSAAYACVMVSGLVQPVDDEAGKLHGLDLIMRHCGYIGQPQYSTALLQATRVWLITAQEVTGKQRPA